MKAHLFVRIGLPPLIQPQPRTNHYWRIILITETVCQAGFTKAECGKNHFSHRKSNLHLRLSKRNETSRRNVDWVSGNELM